MKFQIKKILEYDINNVAESLNNREIFGPLFKSYRIKNNLTLEQCSRSICSPSFLSKVENNLVSIPDKLIFDLCQKFSLNEDDYLNASTNFDKVTELIIKKFQTGDMRANLLKDGLLDNQALLVEFSNYILDNNRYQAVLAYDKLITYLPSLKEKELILFHLLTAIFLYNNLQTMKAYIILEKIKNKGFNSDIDILIDYYYLKAVILLNYPLDKFELSLVIAKLLNKQLLILHSNLMSLLTLYAVENNLYLSDYKLFINDDDYFHAIKILYNSGFDYALPILKGYSKKNTVCEIIYLVALRLSGKEITKPDNNNPLVKHILELFDFKDQCLKDEDIYQNLHINYLNFDNFQNYFLLKYIAKAASSYYESKNKYKYAYLVLKAVFELFYKLKKRQLVFL